MSLPNGSMRLFVSEQLSPTADQRAQVSNRALTSANPFGLMVAEATVAGATRAPSGNGRCLSAAASELLHRELPPIQKLVACVRQPESTRRRDTLASGPFAHPVLAFGHDAILLRQPPMTCSSPAQSPAGHRAWQPAHSPSRCFASWSRMVCARGMSARWRGRWAAAARAGP